MSWSRLKRMVIPQKCRPPALDVSGGLIFLGARRSAAEENPNRFRSFPRANSSPVRGDIFVETPRQMPKE